MKKKKSESKNIRNYLYGIPYEYLISFIMTKDGTWMPVLAYDLTYVLEEAVILLF